MEDRRGNGDLSAARYFVRVGGRAIVETGSTTIELRPRERSLVAAVAFDHPEPVGPARLAALIWGSAVPRTARQSIYNHANRLRTAAPGLLVTEEAGYGFAPGTGTDAELIERWVHDPGELEQWSALADPALDDFSPGDAFVDLFESYDVLARRQHLAEQLADVEDLRIDAALNDGANTAALARAERSVQADPYRERRWWQLALAQARLGRSRDSLNTLDKARRAMGEVGLGPGRALKDLQRLVLEDDLSLFAIEVRGHAAGGERQLGPIGIDGYLHRIDRALDGSDPAAAMLLLGPPGAGKSTIAHAGAVRSAVAGVRVLSAACRPDATRPLEPVIALFDQIAVVSPKAIRDLPSAPPLGALSPTLASVVGADGGLLDRHRLLAVTQQLFEALDGPVLVLVEDVHWAPPRTIEALRVIVGTAGQRTSGSVAFVLTARNEHDVSTSFPAEVVRVEPWDRGDVAEWLAPFADDADRIAEIAPWMLARTGGLPLFVCELTKVLVSEGRVGPESPAPFAPPDTVPAAIASTLAAKVARLSSSRRHALEAAAFWARASRLRMRRRCSSIDPPASPRRARQGCS